MSLTWMQHELHGFIDVYDEDSIKRNQEAGWKVVDRDLEKKVEPASVSPVKEEPAAVPDWMTGAPTKPTLSRKGK